MNKTTQGLDDQTCPKCGSGNVAQILYGLPVFDQELEQAIDQGKVVLGGCMVEDGAPLKRCGECGYRFGSGYGSTHRD